MSVADNLPNNMENALLDALVGTAAFAPTTPIKLALMTANGSDSAAGTEVTGGGYARQSITWTAASNGQIASAAEINFTNMPTCTVVGVEVYDSTATPVRLMYMPLAASKSVTAGDTLQFAAGSVTFSMA